MVLARCLGAEETKIERPRPGDDTRSWGPPFDERGEATYFSAVNRKKKSIGLDLGDPADMAGARSSLLVFALDLRSPKRIHRPSADRDRQNLEIVDVKPGRWLSSGPRSGQNATILLPRTT